MPVDNENRHSVLLKEKLRFGPHPFLSVFTPGSTCKYILYRPSCNKYVLIGMNRLIIMTGIVGH